MSRLRYLCPAMSRQRWILFLILTLALLVVPMLLPYLLGQIVLPVWAYGIYALFVLVNAGIYLSQRLWLIDRYFIRGRFGAYLGWTLLVLVAALGLEYAAFELSGRMPTPDGQGVVGELLGFGVQISQKAIALIINLVVILAALAVALSDEWRLAAFKYREAEKDKRSLAEDIESLKGQVDALKRPAAAPETISVKVDLMMTKIPLDDILYVKSDGDYIVIHTADGRALMVLMTLKALEKQLPFDRFCRIHRSYLVALDKVRGLKGGKVLVGEETLPLSDSCKPGFFELLSHKSIVLQTKLEDNV